MKIGILGAASGGAGGVLSTLGFGVADLGHSVASLRPQNFSLWERPAQNPQLTIAAGIDNFLLKSPRWPSLVSLKRDDVSGSVGDFFSELDMVIVRWPNGVISDKSWPSGVPVVWGLPDQNAFTGVCHYSGSCREFERGCQTCPALRERFSHLSSANLNRKVSLYRHLETVGFVAPSEWIASMARKSILGSYPIRMIPNPLPELFLSNPIQRNGIGSPGPIRVGFAASNVLDPIKGFESISDVLASAQAEGLIKVTTAGRISVSGKRKYPQFTHLGKLSQQEMLRFYDEIDLLVVPSTEEAAGMVALEAMARGVVPVVKTTGGLQELVDNQNGYLFSDSRDLNSILNAIDPLALVGKRFSGLAMATSRSPRSVAAKYLDFGTSLRPSK